MDSDSTGVEKDSRDWEKNEAVTVYAKLPAGSVSDTTWTYNPTGCLGGG